MNSLSSNNLSVIDTVNTTRLLGKNPIDFNHYVTKVIYPNSQVKWRPNAVILVPLTSYHYGLLASPIIHFPINAPLIFTDSNYILQETINEIIRLAPTGKNVPAKVLIVGPISQSIEAQLSDAALTSLRITGVDPILAAYEALKFRYQFSPESMIERKSIMIASVEDGTECIPAAYYSAHMGVPILLSYRDKLPDVTKKALIKYDDKFIYIIGSEKTVSNYVFDEIKDITKKSVYRIGGNTPYEVAVNFSKYHSMESMFGWDIITKNGWAFCFGIPNNWAYNLSACIFAHLGKHSPLLYTENYLLPEVTSEYILFVKPEEQHMHKPPYMHGFILGEQITSQVQVQIDEVLNI